MESIWATLLSFLGEGQPIVKEGDLSLSAGCFESAARAILAMWLRPLGPLGLHVGLAFQETSNAACLACLPCLHWVAEFLALSLQRLFSCLELSCGTEYMASSL